MTFLVSQCAVNDMHCLILAVYHGHAKVHGPPPQSGGGKRWVVVWLVVVARDYSLFDLIDLIYGHTSGI